MTATLSVASHSCQGCSWSDILQSYTHKCRAICLLYTYLSVLRFCVQATAIYKRAAMQRRKSLANEPWSFPNDA